MQYSLRALVLTTTCVAALFGIVSISNWLHAVDGGSERVRINGEAIDLPWVTTGWQPGHSGVWGEDGFITTPIPSTFDGQEIEFDQTLLSISYESNLGSLTYDARVYMTGRYDNSWGNYSMLVNHVGGGNVDAGLSCEHDFDVKSKLPTLRLTKWHNSVQTAEKYTIMFVHDGESFVLQTELANHAMNPSRRACRTY